MRDIVTLARHEGAVCGHMSMGMVHTEASEWTTEAGIYLRGNPNTTSTLALWRALPPSPHPALPTPPPYTVASTAPPPPLRLHYPRPITAHTPVGRKKVASREGSRKLKNR